MKSVRRPLLSFFLLLTVPALAPASPAQSTAAPAAQDNPANATPDNKKLTADQQKQLQGDVDSILQFVSQDTGLAIKKSVKMRLISREAVERELTRKMKEDKGTKRLQRSALVLKKFGLLDPQFDLQPFLIALLKEQIAGYYDDKTKKITLLDWVDPEDQKPVLAHELTHALQDQHIDLNKFEEEIDDSKPSRDVKEDNRRLAVDEQDTTRDAVVEGQAMIPLIDYALRGQKTSILDAPQAVDALIASMASASDSPVLARAPLLLQESLIFPYREGLEFEIAVLKSRGKQGAFAGVLEAPPNFTAQIMHPQMYLSGAVIQPPQMPDVHPLLDATYAPYDLGAMGEFDVKILLDLYTSDQTSAALTPSWRGGLYYAAQRRSDINTPAANKPSSLALLYSSQWATPGAAQKFVEIYRTILEHKYSTLQPARASVEMAQSGIDEHAFTTEQGFVLLSRSGSNVFVSEGFTPEQARKLEVMFFATSSAGTRQAHLQPLPTLSAPLLHAMHTSEVAHLQLSH